MALQPVILTFTFAPAVKLTTSTLGFEFTTTMRGKRAKQYKKLMNAYAHTFGFRAPYQVLMDPEIVLDATKHKMELVRGLEKCLHGMVKPSMPSPFVFHLPSPLPSQFGL